MYICIYVHMYICIYIYLSIFLYIYVGTSETRQVGGRTQVVDSEISAVEKSTCSPHNFSHTRLPRCRVYTCMYQISKIYMHK